MWRTLAKLVSAVLIVVAALGAVFVVGMRRKSPPVLNAVRRTSRAMKPIVLKSAGTPGASASVVRHIGRTSGREYQTPVGAVSTDDGFVIALPYGPNTDWLENVLARGSATIVHEGTTYLVDQPEIVPTEGVQHHFSAADQRAHRWFGVDQSLRVRRVELPPTA